MIDALVVSGDSKIGAAIHQRLACPATTRHGAKGFAYYFDLRGAVALPEAKVTYFCFGINGFKKCAADVEEAWNVNVAGTVRAAREQVRCGHRVVLLSSCAAETHPETVYGDFKFLTECRFLDFGDKASVFRFGPVQFPGRECYPNGAFQPITVDEVVDFVTAPFVPGLHRVFTPNRWEDVA